MRERKKKLLLLCPAKRIHLFYVSIYQHSSDINFVIIFRSFCFTAFNHLSEWEKKQILSNDFGLELVKVYVITTSLTIETHWVLFMLMSSAKL